MKLQPNFSWQKYEGKPEDQKEQFQYQLQQQHILVSNSMNATINDASYFTKERMTGFTWTNNQFLWTKTISGTIVGTALTPYAHGITGINAVVDLTGTAQDAFPMATFALPLPYIAAAALANSLSLFADPTNIYINAPNATWNGYLFNVTITYTKD